MNIIRAAPRTATSADAASGDIRIWRYNPRPLFSIKAPFRLEKLDFSLFFVEVFPHIDGAGKQNYKTFDNIKKILVDR